MKCLTLLCCLLASACQAQERSAHIFLGMPWGTAGDAGAGLKPKPGFAIGVDYWILNEKGNAWSMGATYCSFSRKKKDLKETFEYLTIRGMPLVWNLDRQKRWYLEVGLFGNYLLHQESQMGGSVVDNTKSLQRTYLGPSGGLGVRLGKAEQSRVLFGFRNDFGILGIGKGQSIKFNTISLFAGLEI